MKQWYAFMLLTALALRCSGPTQSAGGSSDSGNPRVVATVHNTDGTPAAGATVRLRRSDYRSQLPALGKTAICGADALTDSNGRFEIAGIDPGSYRIEVTDPSTGSGRGGAVLFACSLDVRDTLDLGVDTLRAFATIAGTVDTTGRAGQRAYVQVEGLARLAAVDDAGRFVMADLPAGNFTVRAVTAQDTAIAAASNITVGPGERTDVTMLNGWRFSKRLYLNTTASGANVSEDVIGFPLLVRPFEYGARSAECVIDGRDIRFIDPRGSVLPCEIERWDSAASLAEAWVLIDTVHGGSEQQWIQMCWGNSTASPVSSSATVFDTTNGFAGVWHLGSAAGRGDACGAYPATPVNYDGNESFAGMVGLADSIAGDDYLDLGDIDVRDSLTIECWIRLSSWIKWTPIVEKALDSGSYSWSAFSLLIDSVDVAHPRLLFDVSVGAQDYACRSATVLQRDTWVHAVCVRKGTAMSLYINGALESTNTTAPGFIVNDRHILLGMKEWFPEYSRAISIDEMRISRVARSAAWARLNYASQHPSQRLIVVNPH